MRRRRGRQADPDLAEAARGLVGPARRLVQREVRSLGRELTGPWREGRSGPAAEAGRWLGVGLAAAAFLFGVAAAVQATRRD